MDNRSMRFSNWAAVALSIGQKHDKHRDERPLWSLVGENSNQSGRFKRIACYIQYDTLLIIV